MYTEVRERCIVENELQSGYYGNDKLVVDREEGIHRRLVVTWIC